MTPETLAAAGWRSMPGKGFTGLSGPFWVRGRGAEREVGLLIEERHSNDHMGMLHGGALMTFADIALGWSVSDAISGSHCVTAQLNVHFVSSAKVGDFIWCRAEVVRAGVHLVVVRGLIKAGDRTIANADGMWKVLRQRNQGTP